MKRRWATVKTRMTSECATLVPSLFAAKVIESLLHNIPPTGGCVKNSFELMLQNGAIAFCGALIVAGNYIRATLRKEGLQVMSPFPETKHEHQNA